MNRTTRNSFHIFRDFWMTRHALTAGYPLQARSRLKVRRSDIAHLFFIGGHLPFLFSGEVLQPRNILISYFAQVSLLVSTADLLDYHPSQSSTPGDVKTAERLSEVKRERGEMRDSKQANNFSSAFSISLRYNCSEFTIQYVLPTSPCCNSSRRDSL